MRPHDLFVFAGAGVSVSMPAGLPMFDWLRDEVFHQLGLDSYVAPRNGPATPASKIAAALAPEPFMLSLTRADVDVHAWLHAVLGRGRSNAAHKVIAELATQGAKVWTVNFDTLIENAGPGLRCVAWPDDPDPDALLLKPHGSLGGQLVVTAEQVLAGLAPEWLAQLRRDVAGRVVIFLGYGGRDLDFHPVWDDVLANAVRVLWFDYANVDRDSRRLLLRRVHARGDLEFADPYPPPKGADHDKQNPSWDFVAWCVENDLVDLDTHAAAQLFADRPDNHYPPLPGKTRLATPAVQGILGDYAAAQRSYLALLADPRYTRNALTGLANSLLNHGSGAVSLALWTARLLPPVGRLAPITTRLERKRITILANRGRHRAVLQATRRIGPQTVSSVLLLRSAALRFTGSLDEAASLAEKAYQRALREQHPVRVAHAAFQKAFALLWAGRLDKARQCVDEELAPHALIAANRWVAWTDFLNGSLAVYNNRPDDALTMYALCETRFRAEALLDGVMSATVASLAAHRQAGDDDAFTRTLEHAEQMLKSGERGQRYYTRRHRFTQGAILAERAEFARIHQQDLDSAEGHYTTLIQSPYPLNTALGHLGLAIVQLHRSHPPDHVGTSLRIARTIGARYLEQRARLVAENHPTATGELFFC